MICVVLSGGLGIGIKVYIFDVIWLIYDLLKVNFLKKIIRLVVINLIIVCDLI